MSKDSLNGPLCSVPLLWENEDPYTYGIKGTGFLMSFNGRIFVLTARHCIKGGDENLRIPATLSGDDIIPLIKKSTQKSADLVADFAIYTAPYDLVLDSPNSIVPISANSYYPASKLARNDYLWVRGYPVERSSVDYNQLLINTQAAQVDAWYRETIEPGLHQLEFSAPDALKYNFNGMSGSPVFKSHPGATSPNQFRLVGILIGGPLSEGNWMGSFISAELFVPCILDIL